MAMAFLAESTRTRAALESAAVALGVEIRDLTAAALTHARGADAAAYLARAAAEADALAIRHTLVPGRTDAFLRGLAAESERPVINLQSINDHPLQTLADVLTLQEARPQGLVGAKVAVVWGWQKTPARPPSVPHGLLKLLPRFGVEVRLAHPPGFELSSDVLNEGRTLAADGGRVTHHTNFDAAIAGADFVYPQGYCPEALLHRPAEAAALAAPFGDWRLDAARLTAHAPNARVLRSLPAAEGEECAPGLYEGAQGLFFAQAAQRSAVLLAVLLLALPAGGDEP